MGENSLEMKHGRFERASDSWEAGVNGAQPGIIMLANPQPVMCTGRSTTRRVRRSTRPTLSRLDAK